MNLDDKVEDTLRFCIEMFKSYRYPVLYCSFGKDSTVLLHLLLSHKIRIPILFHTDPWFRRKFDFANKLISAWNLEVHDYPPAKTSLKHSEAMVALVSEYQTGPHSSLAVLKNSLEFKDGDDPDKFLCGVNFLIRPFGAFVYPWDVALVGHKDCDEDQIFGLVPLHSRVVYRDEGPDFVFPLKEWTHDDVWDYTERFHVPYQMDRYDIKTRRELPDKTPNSDWYEVCIRCIDKRIAGQKVFCPKLERELENVSGAASEYSLVPDYFGLKKG